MNIRNKLIPISFLLFLVISCRQSSPNPSDENSSEAITLRTVEVVHPTMRSFTSDLVISGNTEANRMVKLFPMENGYVVSMRAEIGDKVGKGQTLAVLANPEIEQQLIMANADVESLRAQLEVAHAKVQKSKSLAKAAASNAKRIQNIYNNTPALITAKEFESALAEAQSSEAEINMSIAEEKAANKKVDAADAYKESIVLRKKMLYILAPFNGIVTKRFVDEGMTLRSGLSDSDVMPVYEIQETDPIRLVLPIPESDISSIALGMNVRVLFPEVAGIEILARISRMSGALDPKSKTMRVELDLDNKKGKLIPGMYALAHMNLKSRDGVVSLPTTAQTIIDDAPFLLVVTSEGIVKKIPLRKGIVNKDFFEVLNGEINPESKVIVQGKSLVREGQLVNPIISD